MAEELMVKKNRRKSRRRLLPCLTVGLLVLDVLLILILIATFITKGFGRWVSNVCTTESCVHAASRITKSMNPQADPCDDFYEYACGNYANHHVIPPGKTRFGSFSHLHAELLIKLKGLLEAPIAETDTEAVKQSKNYYISCMNETEIDNLGIKPLKKYVMNDWAVLDDSAFEKSRFNLEDYWLKLAFENQWPGYWNSFFAIGTTVDPTNSSRHMIRVSEGDLGIGGGTRDYYMKGRDDKIILAYEKMAVDLALSLGANQKFAEAEIAKMVDFEMKLANLTLPNEQKQESAGNIRVTNISTMMKDYSGVNWRKVIFETFQKVNITLNDDTNVEVSETPYFENIGELLTATDNRTLSTYMMWKVIKRKIFYLDIKTREIEKEFQKIYKGLTTESPRYERCTSDTKNKFPLVTAKLFVDKYFTKGTADIQDMAERVKVAFRERLSQVEWLDEPSREKAILKVDNIKAKLAYPERIHNDTSLSTEVLNYGLMSPMDYFSNALRITRNKALRTLDRLDNVVDHEEWSMAPVTVNAYYTSSGNRMVFPVGILQPPFYDIDGLKVLNYGALGEVLGHEITHGFDGSGRLYDAYGNKKEWMTNTSVAQFQERVDCIIEQYGNITVKDIGENVNGRLTQGENIADNGALPQALRAYNNWVRENGVEQSLPGLSLTADELFFVSYAQLECQLTKRESLRYMVRTDWHTPARERVLGALMNSVEFANTYNCPSGSNMNPRHKCKVW